MPTPITIIGGGFAGLTAAITAAEAGASVTLHEAHRGLGGAGPPPPGPDPPHEGPPPPPHPGPPRALLGRRGPPGA
ncbi:NAD(P)-binding protein, partial [Streptomyces noursei]|uniref:NAD(P)-binding protein n=1 Tax=Streptomyces noursei TaxID=1971 RepID=UPI00131CB8D7